MTEEQYKFICKWIVDNGNRPMSETDKEIIKQVIDNSKCPEEMIFSILALLSKNQ